MCSAENPPPSEFGKEKPKLTGEALLIYGDIVPLVSYYTGVQANIRDVNGERLLRMYEHLNEKCGKAAATDFVIMLREIPNLSGASVVKSILALAKNNWIYDSEKLSNEISQSESTELDDIKDPQAFALLKRISELNPGSEVDETAIIKEQLFQLLEKAGITIPSQNQK